MNASLPALDIDRLVWDTDRVILACRQGLGAQSLDIDRLLKDTSLLLETGQAPVFPGIPPFSVLVVRTTRTSSS